MTIIENEPRTVVLVYWQIESDRELEFEKYFVNELEVSTAKGFQIERLSKIILI